MPMYAVPERRRMRALLLASLYLMMLLLTIGLMYAEVNHHCTGVGCAVCHTILTLRALLNTLTALLLLLRGMRRVFTAGRRPRAGFPRRLPPRTPVALCTRMND